MEGMQGKVACLLELHKGRLPHPKGGGCEPVLVAYVTSTGYFSAFVDSWARARYEVPLASGDKWLK